MEDIIKTIITKAGARVSLVQPEEGRPFFRYEAGANALTDSFRYIIRQHGQEDTATVTVNVDVPVEENTPRDYFNQQANGFLKCIEKAMDGSPATMALTNLLGIDEGDPLNDDWLDEVFQNFRFFDYAVEEGKPFNMADHFGRYIYVPGGYWEVQKADERVEIMFPSTREVYENDTVFTLKEYKSTEVKQEKGVYNYPTHFNASLHIKDQPYFNLTLGGSGAKAETEYHYPSGIPIAFDISFTANPYSLNTVLRNEGGKQFQAMIQAKDADGCRFTAKTEFELYGEWWERMEDDQIHITMATLQFNDLEFRGLETFIMAVEQAVETQEKVDELVDILCYYKDEPIGKIRFDVEQELVLIEYKDGTSQNINDMVENFLDKYFNQDKPDGTPRNHAFNIGEDKRYRSLRKSAPSVKGSLSNVGSKLAEGYRRRTSRAGVDMKKVVSVMDNFFVQERKTAAAPYDPDAEIRRYEEEMKAQEEKIKAEQEKAAEEARRAQEEAEAKAKAEAEARQLAAAKAREAAKAKALKDAQLKAALEAKKKEEEAAKAKKAAAAKAKAQALAAAQKREAEEAAAKKLADEAAAKRKAQAAAASKRLAEQKAKEEAEKKAQAEAAKKTSVGASRRASAADVSKASAKIEKDEKPKAAKAKPKGTKVTGRRTTAKRKPPGTGKGK